MNLQEGGVISYSELSSQFQSLRGTLESVREKSNRNFSALNRLLKVYFDDARCIGESLEACSCLSVNADCSSLEAASPQVLVSKTSFEGAYSSRFALSFDKISSFRKLITEGSEELDHICQDADRFAPHCKLSFQSQQAAFRKLSSLVEDIQAKVGVLTAAFYGIDMLLVFSQGSAGSAVVVEPALFSALEEERKRCANDISRLATGIQVHDALLQRLEHLDRIFKNLSEDIASKMYQDAGNGYALVMPKLMRLAVAQTESIHLETHAELDAISRSIGSIEGLLGRMVAAYIQKKCCKAIFDQDEAARLCQWVNLSAELALYEQSIEELIDSVYSEVSLFMVRQADLCLRASSLLCAQPDDEGKYALICQRLMTDIDTQEASMQRLEVSLHDVMEKAQGLHCMFGSFVSEEGIGLERVESVSEYLASLLCSDDAESFCHKSLTHCSAASEEHGLFSKYFDDKMAVLIKMEKRIEVAAHISEANESHFRKIMDEVETFYTMQSERAVHQLLCGCKKSDLEQRKRNLEEFAESEEGLELF